MSASEGRRRALDGLRAVFVGVVLARHAGYHLRTGVIGVDGFFVLSGYLITGILTAEFDAVGTIGLGRFYRNRLVRLYPALLVMVLAYTALAPTLHETYRHWAVCGLHAVSYTQDLTDLQGAPLICVGLGHTWSLAVEEQFYLLWPLALLALRRRRLSPVGPLVLAIAVSVTLLAVLTAPSRGPALTYIQPWTRCFELFFGCLIAITFDRIKLPAWSWNPIGIVAALLFAWTAWGHQLKITGASRGITVLAPLAVLIAGVLVLTLEKSPDCLVARLLSLQPLVYLGRISYGIYLYHFALFEALASHLHAGSISSFAFESGLAIVISALSFHLVEQPMIRRYRRPPATVGRLIP